MSEMMKMEQLCRDSKEAKYEAAKLTTLEKNRILVKIAKALLEEEKKICLENEKDLMEGRKKGLSEGLLDRLMLNKERIQGMATGLIQISELEDPVGQILETFSRPNGLEMKKVRVPLGVIGIIYEARPNVTADAFGLCFKTGNAVILKGGSDALYSNRVIVGEIRRVLKEEGMNENVVQLIDSSDREITTAFMKMNQYVDVLIPRGGAALIQSVVRNSTIPVIETGTGNCHIYVDEEADLSMAVKIIMNAKTQRISVCNACESLVVHEKVAPKLLPLLAEELKQKNVMVHSDKEGQSIVSEWLEATDEDYGREYLDYEISVKTVSDLSQAIAHINKYSTKHSEAIITENKEHAERFLQEIDSACVYVNASTRFTDGFEFGFGAEIGISTQKLHARGPMGLKELTSYKYQIHGNGQIR